jgi:hypothetical protein
MSDAIGLLDGQEVPAVRGSYQKKGRRISN